VRAKGNSNSQLSYLFYDNSPARGLNYYKLSGVDRNGKETFLGYTTVSNRSSLPLFDLYPNPAQNNITLSLKNFSTPTVSYELYNAQGVLVRAETIDLVNGNMNHNIDLSQLDNGFYYVKVNNGDELLKRTFIKSE
ncbi:MAG TPA: T9SS type A sorting domain-containing protein, partial [Bacteroidia bacterium]|nr:T9SS type A sorting domain-containing protein [Bacteroidia bacterium]